jgi:hypothetical protein
MMIVASAIGRPSSNSSGKRFSGHSASNSANVEGSDLSSIRNVNGSLRTAAATWVACTRTGTAAPSCGGFGRGGLVGRPSPLVARHPDQVQWAF